MIALFELCDWNSESLCLCSSQILGCQYSCPPSTVSYTSSLLKSPLSENWGCLRKHPGEDWQNIAASTGESLQNRTSWSTYCAWLVLTFHAAVLYCNLKSPLRIILKWFYSDDCSKSCEAATVLQLALRFALLYFTLWCCRKIVLCCQILTHKCCPPVTLTWSW